MLYAYRSEGCTTVWGSNYFPNNSELCLCSVVYHSLLIHCSSSLSFRRISHSKGFCERTKSKMQFLGCPTSLLNQYCVIARSPWIARCYCIWALLAILIHKRQKTNRFFLILDQTVISPQFLVTFVCWKPREHIMRDIYLFFRDRSVCVARSGVIVCWTRHDAALHCIVMYRSRLNG